MNNYIDNLLTYKNDEYNKTNENIDKKSTNIYLDSCIIFIYDNKNKNIIPFLKEIVKEINSKKRQQGLKTKQLIRNSTSLNFNI